MRVSYNISNRKKIDIFTTLRYALVLLLLAALFAYLGFRTISVKDQKLRTDIEKLSYYNNQLEEMNEKTHQYRDEIRVIQKKWRNKVRYSNLLIAGKRFNIIRKLDMVEKILPVGVYVKEITMKIGSGSKVLLTVVANSYANLFQVYKKFSPYDPSIASETEIDGIHQARISIILKNTSKEKENENETK